MAPLAALFATIAFLLAPGEQPEDPWKAKVPAAVERAERRGTVTALKMALDVAWRADDWETGLRLARQGRERHGDQPALYGHLIRALWRAGCIEEAERLAANVSGATADRITAQTMIVIHLSRGELELVRTWAKRLEALRPKSAEDFYHIFLARYALMETEGQVDLLRRLEQHANADNGYPEHYLAESVDGLAEFLAAVGPRPLNQIAAYGSAPMSPLSLVSLPACDVHIDGNGPYRMVVDTGGSIMLSVDTDVADEIGLKSIAKATVRGVSGLQNSDQALVDELKIGSITCTRVVTRIFPVRAATANTADGIIGTGLFAAGRMTLDFAGGNLIVAPSSAKPGAGREVTVRVVADAKLLVPVTMEGEAAMALLDSGADMVVMAPSRLKRMFPDRKITTFDPGLAIGVGSDRLPGVSFAPGVDLAIGGREYEDYGGLGLDVLDTLLSPIMGVQTDILIGMPTFRDSKSFTIDYPTCKLWIDWLD